MEECFPFIIVVLIQHISVQLVLMSIHLMFCVSFENNTILRRNNILKVKFHFAGELRGFDHCVCFVEFLDIRNAFRKCV